MEYNASSSILNLHVLAYASWPMISLCAWYSSVAQTEVEN